MALARLSTSGTAHTTEYQPIVMPLFENGVLVEGDTLVCAICSKNRQANRHLIVGPCGGLSRVGGAEVSMEKEALRLHHNHQCPIEEIRDTLTVNNHTLAGLLKVLREQGANAARTILDRAAHRGSGNPAASEHHAELKKRKRDKNEVNQTSTPAPQQKRFRLGARLQLHSPDTVETELEGEDKEEEEEDTQIETEVVKEEEEESDDTLTETDNSQETYPRNSPLQHRQRHDNERDCAPGSQTIEEDSACTSQKEDLTAEFKRCLDKPWAIVNRLRTRVEQGVEEIQRGAQRQQQIDERHANAIKRKRAELYKQEREHAKLQNKLSALQLRIKATRNETDAMEAEYKKQQLLWQQDEERLQANVVKDRAEHDNLMKQAEQAFKWTGWQI